MVRHNNDWSREEHILAFNLYCKIPFGSIHMHNPRVIELARILGRSVGAVSLKLSNFARLDPALQARGIRGMSHGAKGEEQIWHEFADRPENLAFESERLFAARVGKSIRGGGRRGHLRPTRQRTRGSAAHSSPGSPR